MSMKSAKQLKTVTKKVRGLVENSLAENGGLLRLAPCWVPRSFLQPGKRLKLHPDDLYAFGLNRGGIDERWFASTTVAANEGAPADEGLLRPAGLPVGVADDGVIGKAADPQADRAVGIEQAARLPYVLRVEPSDVIVEEEYAPPPQHPGEEEADVPFSAEVGNVP